MILGIDHVVILVNDLAQASADYAALGFTVTPGGEHTGGATHNALVPFADGSYFELIAFKRDDPGHRWARHAGRREGLVDFALLPGAIESDLNAARAGGAAYVGPLPGGRLRPDGLEVAWQLGLPPADDLPFLCGDVTPRERRVPGGAARQHPNGASGIATVWVATNDLAAAASRYRALLGQEADIRADAELQARVAVFNVGQATIVVASADSGSSPVQAHVHAWGPGPYALALAGGAGAATPDLKLSHGVRLL